MDAQQTREMLVASRALQLLEDTAESMEEQHLRGLFRKPRFLFRAVFRPEMETRDVNTAPSYSGMFAIEGRGRGIASYYPFGSDERRLARSGFVPVLSLRIVARERWLLTKDEEESAPLSTHQDEVCTKTATCLYLAPRLVPVTFREDVRRFMRDYFGHDEIRFFRDQPARGTLLAPWTASGR